MSASVRHQTVVLDPLSHFAYYRWHFLTGALLIAVVSSRIWVKLETTQVGYQLAKERQLTVELDMQRRELELQLALLVRPDALARRASEKLGLSDLGAARSITLADVRD